MLAALLLSACSASRIEDGVTHVRSDYMQAWFTRHSRKLRGYDPGITGGGVSYSGSVDCRACAGLGGFYIPPEERRRPDRDMSTCDTCWGTGEVTPVIVQP